MSTIAIKNNAVINNANSSHMTLGERFKKYILENATVLAASEQVALGNPTALKGFMDSKNN